MEPNEEMFKEIELKRDFEVQDDGKVIMTETHVTRTVFEAKDFRTFYSEHIKIKESNEKQISEEEQNKIKKDLETIKKRMEEIEPVLKEAEEKTAENYEKKKIERVVKRIRDELAKKKHERQNEYLLEAYNNIRDNEKEAFKQLTMEERNEMIRVKKRVMEMERSGNKAKKK
jgi:hypothetical protein